MLLFQQGQEFWTIIQRRFQQLKNKQGTMDMQAEILLSVGAQEVDTSG